MPRNHRLLISLTLVSAIRLDQWDHDEVRLYKALSEEAWKDAVSMAVYSIQNGVRGWQCVRVRVRVRVRA